MPTPAILGPIIGGIAAAGLSAGASAAMQPDDNTKHLADSNKKALASFAQRMAQEDESMRNSDDYLLRPGGRPIRFGAPRFNFVPQNKGSMLLSGGQ